MTYCIILRTLKGKPNLKELEMLVKVTCDAEDCYFEENYAVSDIGDLKIEDLKKRMKTNGWTIMEEDHFCPNCTSGL